jgi:predicted ATPase
MQASNQKTKSNPKREMTATRSFRQQGKHMPEHPPYDVTIRWRNFRGFEDTGWLKLRPLTILIGPNNSGKTSVFAPLLLLSQTFNSDDSVTPLVTRGPLVDVGGFDDFVHLHDAKRVVTLGVGFHIHEPDHRTKPVGTYVPGGVELAVENARESKLVELRSYTVLDIFGRRYLTQSRSSSGRQFGLKGLKYSKMKPHEVSLIRRSRPTNFWFTPTSPFANPDQRSLDRTKGLGRFSTEFGEYLSVLGFAFQGVRPMLGELGYIGPVRQRLRRYYEVMGSLPRSVGPLGRFAPEIFRRMNRTAQQTVNKWVRAFELGDTLRVKPLGTDIFSLIFENKGGRGPRDQNIADAGFGVSQVLPLIVQASTDEPLGLTIAEQPEIHLNPRLQSSLADLFVAMANKGQRVIVETHSEHLVLRLRRLIAEGHIQSDAVGLHFVERKGGVSVIREVPIDRTGHINGSHWPAGFFEDSLREALALASAQSTSQKLLAGKQNKGRTTNAPRHRD